MGLFRLLLGLLVVWLVCRVFYKMGQKSMLDGKNRQSDRNRKKVDSSVVDKPEDSRQQRQ